MILVAYNGSQMGLSLGKNEGLVSSPKLFLDLPRIVVSDLYTQYQEIHLNDNLIGAKKFLDVDNELDVMVFDRNEGYLVYLELNLPLSIRVVDTTSFQQLKTGGLQLKKMDSFFLGRSTSGFYNTSEDTLGIFYDMEGGNDPIEAVGIAKGFCALLKNGVLVGWQLKNCCQYICNSGGKKETKCGSQMYAILTQFLKLYNNTLFDKLEKHDLSTKSEIIELHQQASKYSFSAIVCVLEEWLESYL